MKNDCGLYIHIPFCSVKCLYCDFFSKSESNYEIENYIENLLRLINEYGRIYSDKIFDTIYIGGGTPSVIGTENLIKIIKKSKESFNIKLPEITIEMNPCSAKKIDFEKLSKVGVNRISLGVQTSNEEELKLLGRIHTNEDVIETVKNIKKAKIDNISFDLMLGISKQTEESLKSSIDFCIDNGAKHISAYILKVENNTPYKKLASKLNLPNEDKQADFYEFMQKYLEDNGYNQYEISNFSIVGYSSRHNTKYWNCDEYLGIGASAHSMMNGKRFYFPRDMQAFYNNKTISDGEGASEQEYVMLRLRLKEGIIFKEYENLFKKPIPLKYIEVAKKYSKYGLTQVGNGSISLTKKGFLVSNSIIAEIIE